jgi:hypothetical protein
MIVYKRTVNGEVIEREEKQVTQAAFNSDGQITLRGYDCFNGGDGYETMCVLNRKETRAIFNLMKEFAALTKNDLPF